ncbi:hypothetical protein ACFWMP_27890 [Paenibacillus sp. NPDC058367]|uniref:hypothetical protein n=1 Tax=Paenibacillus sp. NPDC058367 TaxID=3346460 RepID=UPI003652BD1F
MQTTGNLGLKKPEGTDIVDIADLNGNMDILDNAVNSKVDKASGKQLSTNDYTTAEKTKLAGIATGANNYLHPNHTGDVTSNGDGVTAIAAGAIVDADVNVSAGIAWSKVSKTGASLADLPTRSAGDLSSGTLPAARLPAATGDVTSPAGSNVFTLSAGIQGQINSKAPLATTPQQTTADITYYVRTDGSDSNTGLANTAAGAFKTITKAISLIPKMVNHKVIINIAAGTYSESVIVSGLVTATDFSIIGSGVVNIVSLEVINCYGTINITGLTATTTTKDSFSSSSSARVVFTSCIATVVSTFASFWSGSSNVFINRCTISNRSVGISALAESMVYVGECTGVNNGIAYLSGYGSYLGYQSSVPSGAMVVQDSGMLVPGSGVLNPWGDNTTGMRTGIAIGGGLNAQSIPANVLTKVSYFHKYYDYLDEWSNSKFTAKKNGLYAINTMLMLIGAADGVVVEIFVYKNGVRDQCMGRGGAVRMQDLATSGSIITDLGAGDTLEIYMQQSGATSLDLTNDGVFTNLRITRVS